MADSFIQLNNDGPGKKVDTRTENVNGDHRQVMVIGDPVTNANVANVTATGAIQTDGSLVTQPISAASLPLPSGAATAANQSSAQTTLTTIATNTAQLATTQPVSVASLPLPVGASTSGNQATAQTTLSTIAANQTSGGEKSQVVDGSGSVVGPFQALAGTNYLPTVAASSGVNGAAVPTRITQIGGSDGANLRVLKTSATGVVSVDGSGVTQPISAVSLPLPAGASTEATLALLNGKVTAVNTGAVTISAALPTGTNVIGHVISDSGSTVAVSNFPATQPVSAVSLPLPTGASTSANQTNGSQQTQIIQGGNVAFVNATNELLVTDTDLTNTQGSATAGQLGPLVQAAVLTSPPVYVTAQTSPITMTTQGAVRVDASTTASSLIVSTTAATGVGVTATLPAVAGQFHYITGFTIVKYFTVANAASATPLVVTTTNLPGSLALTFGQPLGTIGTTDFREESFTTPVKSSAVNTATTIVAPATTGIIWRINVFYYTAP